MCYKLFYFVFLSLFLASAYCEEPSNILPHAEIEGDPSTLIAGCVNAITGNYSDAQLDFVVAGTQALPFQRFYCSTDWQGGSLEDGWNHSYPSEGSLQRKDFEYYYARIPESSGGSMLYFSQIGVPHKKGVLKKHPPIVKFDTNKTKYLKGLTNTGSGEISGRTNLRNQTMVWESRPRVVVVQQANGVARRFFEAGSGLIYLNKEVHPNGNCIYYHYKKGKLAKVAACDFSGKRELASLSFAYIQWNKKDPILRVTGSDGQQAEYLFCLSRSKDDGLDLGRLFLRSVKRPGGPPEEYRYCSKNRHHVEQIIEKKRPEGRIQQIKYYRPGINEIGALKVRVSDDPKKDSRAGKVFYLKAPVGHDDKLLITHRFLYHYEIPRKKVKEFLWGHVDVLDIFDHKTRYCFSNKERLTAIERYLGTGNYHKYSTEKLFWGQSEKYECNLVCKALLEADDTIRSCRYLEYDENHNVIAEHILGNLSGANPAKLILNADGIPQNNACECYTVQRAYYPAESFNLLKSETLPNGRTTTYRYWKNSDLLEARLVSENGHIVAREFREYDALGTHIKTIVDNGCGQISSDYTDVSVRRITEITPRDIAPCLGLPERIAERYYDPMEQVEHDLGLLVNTYSKEGRITDQEHYDANHALRFVLHWEYDGMGNVVLERDALGQEIRRTYDPNGNKILEVGPSRDYYTQYIYDFSNRLVSEQRICANGDRLSLQFGYDLLGNRVESYDIFGNKTAYKYDDFNRLVCTTLPCLVEVNGQRAPLQTHKEYDIAGNIIAETDALGNITYRKFNIRGQPILVEHPDGTQEHFEYNLNGSLKCQTALNGTSTHFTYDLLGNIVRKESRSASGEFLNATTATYRGSLITSETDANGNLTTYSYDGAGRTIKVSKPTGWTAFEYDSLGRKFKTKEWIGPLENDVSVSLIEYDLLNRPIEERVEDYRGTILTRRVYQYDEAGNRSAVTTFSDLGASTTQTFYNAHGQVYKVIDPIGHETLTHYNYRYMNSDGQKVLQTTVVDALGNCVITTQDTLGRIVSTVRKDVMGEETARTTQTYDGRGKQVKRVDTIKTADTPDRDFVTEWQYDAAGRLVALYEAVETTQARCTFYTYNKKGEKIYDILADDVLLRYEYDSCGRLASYDSSDNTVCYHYAYDANSNILSVTDEIHETVTTRSYDAANRVVGESLANGLSLTYEYDGKGRMIRMVLPDLSGVVYEYDAANLKKVGRIDPDGYLAYSHRYLAHDQSGNVTSVQMIQEAGQIAYSWDKLGRLQHLQTRHFEEQVLDGGYDAVGNLIAMQRRDVISTNSCQYLFDPLYQLTSEEGTSSHRYAYDSLNNRLKKDDADCDIDELNQLIRQGEDTYTYDRRGNRITHGNILYAYDALGRLRTLEKEGMRWEYRYDPFNRRVSKAKYDASDNLINIENYLYADQAELGFFDDQGALIQFRLLGKGLGAEIGAAVAIELSGNLFAPIHDHNGNVVALVSPETGDLIEAYRFTAFGEETRHSMAQPTANPWRFSSKRFDPESELIYFGRRYFDPKVGRWATPDPSGDEDGPNPYAYVHNNPLTHIDLYGLFCFCPLLDYNFYSGAGAASQLRLATHCFETARDFYLGVNGIAAARNGYVPSKIRFDDGFEERYPGHERSSRVDLKLPELKHGWVSFINGVRNSLQDVCSSMQLISSFGGGCNVHGVHNASGGPV